MVTSFLIGIRWENLKIDVIIPIPIHRTRERKRGYNQTELMAARLAQLWGKTLMPDALQRTRETILLRSLSLLNGKVRCAEPLQ